MYLFIEDYDASEVVELLKEKGFKHEALPCATDAVIHTELDFSFSSAKAMFIESREFLALSEEEQLEIVGGFYSACNQVRSEFANYQLIDDTFEDLKVNIDDKLRELVPEKIKDFI